MDYQGVQVRALRTSLGAADSCRAEDVRWVRVGVLEQAAQVSDGERGAEEEETRMKKPKPQIKNAVIVNLLLAEIAACRREMIRLRKMLKDLVG